MKNYRSLFMDCSKTTHCCDKAQYDEASFFEKFKIHLHLFFCKPCKKYTDNNRKLTELVKKANLKSCTEAQKKAWKERIIKEDSRKSSQTNKK